MPSTPAEPRTKPAGLKPRAWAMIALGVLLLGAGAALIAGSPPQGASLIGGPFQLIDAEGRTVTDADFRGHPFLVYFGYAHCPDICPTTLAELSEVLKRLPEKPIKALFVTVDPERDTARIMADYVSSFDPRIVGLSGSLEQIAAMEKGYRVFARKAPGKGGDYTMDHSSIVYLMDARGGFIEALNLDRKPEDAAEELGKYF